MTIPAARPRASAASALLASVLLAPSIAAAPVFQEVVTDQDLAAAGFGGANPLPIGPAISGGEVVVGTGPQGLDLVRVGGPDFSEISLVTRINTTPAPDTGNPFRNFIDYGFTGEGAYFTGVSRRTEPDGALQAGVYTQRSPGGPLATFVNLDTGLPTLPTKYEFDGDPLLSGFFLGSGADAGAYLNNQNVGVQRLAAVGDAYAGNPGLTAERFQGVRFALDGRTLVGVVEGSDGRDRLTSVSPGNGGELRSLLAAGDTITDDTGDRLRVEFFQNVVASDNRAVSLVSTRDFAAGGEREALVSFENGVTTVFARTDAGSSQFAGGFNATDGGLATDGDFTVFLRSDLGEDGFRSEGVFAYDGDRVTRLFGTGDEIGGGELLDIDFTSRSLSDGILAFTAVYTDDGGDQRVGVFTAVVPEPGTLLVVLGGGIGLLLRRRAA